MHKKLHVLHEKFQLLHVIRMQDMESRGSHQCGQLLNGQHRRCPAGSKSCKTCKRLCKHMSPVRENCLQLELPSHQISGLQETRRSAVLDCLPVG